MRKESSATDKKACDAPVSFPFRECPTLTPGPCPERATEFTQALFATFFMELRGELELGRHLVAKAGRGGGKLNALVRRFRLLCVPLRVLRGEISVTTKNSKQHRSLNFHVLRVPIPVTANYLPVMAKLSPCYCPVTRAPPIFAQPIVIEMDFPAKTGPETANSPCFPPVIREYQGESG